MPDNRIISTSKYVVNGVTRITAENSITKRPYEKNDASSDKRHNNSNSFDDTLHSKSKKKTDNDDSSGFSNELDNKLRLKSEENSRLVQARFNHHDLGEPKPIAKPIETELHNKLGQAMEEGKIDATSLTKKIELLNALRHESK